MWKQKLMAFFITNHQPACDKTFDTPLEAESFLLRSGVITDKNNLGLVYLQPVYVYE